MSRDSKGYYKLLGLEPGCDISKVKSAFKKKQTELHTSGPTRRRMRESPEYKKLSDKQKEEKEKKLDDLIAHINVAYQILGDKHKKKEYDEGTGDFSEFSGFNPEDFSGFGDLFSAFTGGGRKRKAKVEDSITKVKLSLKESLLGKTPRFRTSVNKKCVSCNGKGYPKINTCASCDGRGSVYLQRQMGIMVTRQEVQCPRCNGSGGIGMGPPCATCHGKKVTREASTIEVRIPPGVQNGKEFVFEQQGNYENDKIPGDLVFVVSIADDPNYKRVNDDLVGTVDIDLLTCLTGGHVYFTHLDGRKLSAKVQQIRKFGDAIRVYGEGFPGSNGQKGDLYLKLNVLMNGNINKKALEKVIPSLVSPPKEEHKVKGGYYATLPVENQDSRGRSRNGDEEEFSHPFFKFTSSGFF